MILFDAHCDTISHLLRKGASLHANPLGHWDLQRATDFAHCAQIFAIFADSEGKTDAALAAIFSAQLELFFEELSQNREKICLCRTGDELRAAWQLGRVVAFLSVEGAQLLGCSREGLVKAHALGVRAVNLTWNRSNVLCGSIAQEPTRGLSEQGRAFVTCMQELGMLVDVSHLSEPGFWDVLSVANRPVIASHSNARALCPHPRNLTDAQFLALVENGGLLGLNLYADFLGERADFNTIHAHLAHFLALGGEKHLAFGADLDGCDQLPHGFEAGLSGFLNLYEYLLQKNYSEALLQKLCFQNLIRVVDELCTM